MTKELIKFERNGCNPCVMVANFLNDLGVEHTTVNVEDDIDKAIDFQVMSTPITVLLVDGKEVKRSRGFNPPELEEIVAELNK